MKLKRTYILLFCFIIFQNTHSQNLLNIPPALSGTNFSLAIQSGTQTFYTGYNTPTYGINGTWMAPTLIWNKGDSLNINVTNNLNTSTTIHWHGLHVAPQYDGGPFQLINIGSTWNPTFKVRNDAGTFWYHPHGVGKTDLHVSKGIAGMIIVRDPIEAALNLPRTYGVDDIPVIVQSKAFDVLKQIAIATEMDTALFVNGTLNPYTTLPAQVVRMRLLNGSSMRTYLLGFSGNLSFHLIATDGGLLDSSLTLTKIRLSPGERAEVLLNLSGMQTQTLSLRNFGSQLPNGIYGAASVGIGTATITGYNQNPLNGADYDIMKITVSAPTATPVTTIASTLGTLSPWPTTTVTVNRRLEFNTLNAGDSTQMAEGSFTINGKQYVMDTINITTQLNNIEIWKLVNKTLIAHPFHIHDEQFYIVDINGSPPPAFEHGKKDVVLVMPGDSLRFITKFEDFSSNTLPYMYHCHLLHHEDDGMMGQFIVGISTGIKEFSLNDKAIILYPNPNNGSFKLLVDTEISDGEIIMYNSLGQKIHEQKISQGENNIITNGIAKGLLHYIILQNKGQIGNGKLVVE